MNQIVNTNTNDTQNEDIRPALAKQLAELGEKDRKRAVMDVLAYMQGMKHMAQIIAARETA